jgi:hypothetical protein
MAGNQLHNRGLSLSFPNRGLSLSFPQLARIKKTIRAQTVLAHYSGLSCGARLAPTGELQQQKHFVQFASLIAADAS